MANAGHKPKADKCRLLVFNLLRQVNDGGAYANLRLPELLRASDLDERDRAFATELSYGTLRMQGKHDAFIKANTKRPFEEIDGDLLDVLRMGLHQLNEMRVADHAAVGETVEVARALLGEAKASFVNAMLRESTRQPDFYQRFEVVEGDSAKIVREKYSILYSHPEWIVGAFFDQLQDWQRVKELLIANNTPVAPHLIAWPGRSTSEELLQVGGERIPGTRYGVYSSQAPYKYKAIIERRAGVQDLGSQIIAEAFVETRDSTKTQESWLDMCAGPGGKAAALYTSIHERFPHDTFMANEPSEHRAELVAQVVPRDLVHVGRGEDLPSKEQRFDRILIDAPCSGLGALRRRPEARWRKTQNDLKELVKIQKDLLNAGAELIQPGGVIAYVTCSPHLLETKAQVLEFLKKHPNFTLISASAYLPPEISKRVVLQDGTLQMWSDRDGSDSMYMALLRREG